MNNCPYCGSPIPDGAQFCTACMRSLVGKRDVTPKIRNTRRWIAVVLCAMILVAAVVSTAVFLNMRNENGDDRSGESSETSAGEPETEGVEPEGIMESLMMFATYYTGTEGYSALWSPDEYVHTHTVTDADETEWMIYNIPLKIEGAVMRVFICRDGRVITTVGGLTDATLDMGDTLSLLMTTALYSERYADSVKAKDAVLRAEMTETTADEATVAELGLPDYAAKAYDDDGVISRQAFDIGDHGEYKAQTMVIDTRTATVDGGTVYDIITLHSFE